MTHDGCCSGNSCSPRNFLTKDERIDILKEHKDNLVKETKGVEERIRELEKR